jgi:microcystin-dependent protein
MGLKLTGTPTANIDVVVPAVTKVYVIDGSGIAGSFTVSIAPNGGGTSVAFTAGESGVVYCDGTDVKQIIKTVTAFQQNMIMLWSGSIAYIPSGWQLCDGTNGTPDLRNRFIVGAQEDVTGVANTNLTGSLTISGGSTSSTSSVAGAHSHTGNTGAHTLSLSEIPAHSHLTAVAGTVGTTLSSGSQRIATFGNYGSSNNAYIGGTTGTPNVGLSGSVGGGGSHSHTISEDGSHSHTVDVNPPYYALAYIMKT